MRPSAVGRISSRAVVQLPIDRLVQLGIAENAEQKQMFVAAELQQAGMCCFFHLFSPLVPWPQLLKCIMPANQSQIPLTSLQLMSCGFQDIATSLC